MLDSLGWLSLNQMAAETRLIEASKTANLEDYCLNNILKKRFKSSYSTRNKNQDFFERGVDDLHGSASFVNPTARIWNAAPSTVTHAETESQARKAIRNFVQTLPI